MTVSQIAELCHEANRTYCHVTGDDTQMPWAEALDWQKESAIVGVRFALAHPEATPEVQHESWLKDKQRENWVYGPVKNAVAKEHPCMVAYLRLPIQQRMKDNLFLAIVDCFRRDVTY